MIYELLYSFYILSLARGIYMNFNDFINHPKILYLMYQYKYNKVLNYDDSKWELLSDSDTENTIPAIKKDIKTIKMVSKDEKTGIFNTKHIDIISGEKI